MKPSKLAVALVFQKGLERRPLQVSLMIRSTKEVGSKLVGSDESGRLAKDGAQCSRGQLSMKRDRQYLPGSVGQLTS